MIFGTGFAPFRGGPLHYLRELAGSVSDSRPDAEAPSSEPSQSKDTTSKTAQKAGKKAAKKTAKKTARTETDSTGKKAVKASGEEKKDD